MVTGRWWEKNDGQTNRDFWRGSRGEKRCVLTPFANNGFMKKDFHLLGSCMGGHACALPLPHLASAVHVFTRKPSPRAPPRSQAAPGTARASLTNGHLPGKIGTVYGNSRHGRWPARRFWDVCWGLGLRRWRRLVLRISKEKDRAETAREKEARCTYASSPSTQDFCRVPGLGTLLQRMAFSETLPSFIRTEKEHLVGWGPGQACRRKRWDGTQEPLLCTAVPRPVGTGSPMPAAQLANNSGGKDSQGQPDVEWGRHCHSGCSL